jgi:hypothetical protein
MLSGQRLKKKKGRRERWFEVQRVMQQGEVDVRARKERTKEGRVDNTEQADATSLW